MYIFFISFVDDYTPLKPIEHEKTTHYIICQTSKNYTDEPAFGLPLFVCGFCAGAAGDN
jgi:hypothetical protein